MRLWLGDGQARGTRTGAIREQPRGTCSLPGAPGPAVGLSKPQSAQQRRVAGSPAGRVQLPEAGPAVLGGPCQPARRPELRTCPEATERRPPALCVLTRGLHEG